MDKLVLGFESSEAAILKPDGLASPDMAERNDNAADPAQKKLSISAEKLIKLVKNRPCLWNKSLPEYKDKTCRDAAWNEIFREIEPGFDDCHRTAKRELGLQINKKWCNIRDAYVKARNNYRQNKCNKPYVHARRLTFLDQFLAERSEIVEEKVESDETEEEEESDNWCNETVYIEDEPSAKKPKIEVDVEREDNNLSLESDNIVTLLTKMIQREEDEDRAFFKSIEPSVKALSEDAKLEFRINVLKLIKDLKYKYKNGTQLSLKMSVED